MLNVAALVYGIVDRRIDSDVVDGNGYSVGALTTVESSQIGHKVLQNEESTLAEVFGSSFKTFHLGFLGQQRKQRAEHNIDQAEFPLNRDFREISERDRDVRT